MSSPSQHNQAATDGDAPVAAPGDSGRPGSMSSPGGPGQPTMTGPAGPGPDGRQLPPGLAPGERLPWKVAADGRTVFRRGAPLILWWVWIVFAVFNISQVVIPDHDYFSIELTAGLLAVTGVAYATALRPRLVADSDGILVRNPVRDHLIRWGALNAVYLGDSVELSCARPAPRKDKTIYCWALYSGRRARLKSQQLGVRSWTRPSSRIPAEASELATKDAAQLMAAELGRRSSQARKAGAPAAILQSRWSVLPIACMLVPAAALLALALAR